MMNMGLILQNLFKPTWTWSKTTPAPTPIPEKKVKKYNEMVVMMNDGTSIAWTCHNWSGTEISKPWEKIYDWFLNSDKETFLMKCETNEAILTRKSIRYINIQIKER